MTETLLLLSYGAAFFWIAEEWAYGVKPVLNHHRIADILWTTLIPVWFSLTFILSVQWLKRSHPSWDVEAFPFLPVLLLTAHGLWANRKISLAAAVCFIQFCLWPAGFAEGKSAVQIYGLFAHVYFLIAVFRILFEGIRFRLKFIFVPEPWQGLPVLLTAAFILALAMSGWAGTDILQHHPTCHPGMQRSSTAPHVLFSRDL